MENIYLLLLTSSWAAWTLSPTRPWRIVSSPSSSMKLQGIYGGGETRDGTSIHYPWKFWFSIFLKFKYFFAVWRNKYEKTAFFILETLCLVEYFLQGTIVFFLSISSISMNLLFTGFWYFFQLLFLKIWIKSKFLCVLELNLMRIKVIWNITLLHQKLKLTK